MDNYSLKGRTAVVTGASRGLGLSISKNFFQAGADLVVCARAKETLEEAAQEIRKLQSDSRQKILSLVVDVTDSDSVAELSRSVFSEFGAVQILVNNAGVYGPMGSIEEIDWEHFKRAIEINLYGSVLMCRAFLPHFRNNKYGKIIQLSGGGATNPMPKFEAYAASKAAVVRFIESLSLDCIDDNIYINAIAPGLLDTRMLDEVLSAGPNLAGDAYYSRMLDAKKNNKCVPLEHAAHLCRFLASSASDGISGKLISAVWDDYEDWPNHLEELQSGDLYTLRRITGRDRSTNWGDK